MEFRKMVTINPVYETAKETLMYSSLMDSVGEGEEGKI